MFVPNDKIELKPAQAATETLKRRTGLHTSSELSAGARRTVIDISLRQACTLSSVASHNFQNFNSTQV